MRAGRRGRPSLLGTAARTAVIAGTAQSVAGNVARRQNAAAQQQQAQQEWQAQQQWAAQQAAAQEAVAQHVAAQQAPPAGDAGQRIEQLKDLAALRDQGILTDAEFEQQKAVILNG